jgi:hypothetical protein
MSVFGSDRTGENIGIMIIPQGTTWFQDYATNENVEGPTHWNWYDSKGLGYGSPAAGMGRQSSGAEDTGFVE